MAVGVQGSFEIRHVRILLGCRRKRGTKNQKSVQLCVLALLVILTIDLGIWEEHRQLIDVELHGGDDA